MSRNDVLHIAQWTYPAILFGTFAASGPEGFGDPSRKTPLWCVATDIAPESDADRIFRASRIWKTGHDRGFYYEWAESGFCTLEGDGDDYMSNLAFSDTSSVIDSIVLPAPAILFRLPSSNMFTRVTLSVRSEAAIYIEKQGRDACVAPGISMTFESKDMFVTGYSENIGMSAVCFDPVFADAEWLKDHRGSGNREVSDPTRSLTHEERRWVDISRREVAGLLVEYCNPANWRRTGLKRSAAKRVRGIPPNHRVTFIGRSVRHDFRPAVSEYVRNDTSTRGPQSFHYIVRGHWHTVLHGPGKTMRRLQWYEPHWSHAADPSAPILVRPHLIGPVQ